MTLCASGTTAGYDHITGSIIFFALPRIGDGAGEPGPSPPKSAVVSAARVDADGLQTEPSASDLESLSLQWLVQTPVFVRTCDGK